MKRWLRRLWVRVCWLVHEYVKVSRRDTADRYYLVSLFGFALFLHRLHKDEEKNVFHTHPWNAISLIFGYYHEQRMGKKLKVRYGLHFLPANTPHRLELPYGTVWTLFFHFRRFNRWTVRTGDNHIIAVEPWRHIGGPTAYRPDHHRLLEKE